MKAESNLDALVFNKSFFLKRLFLSFIVRDKFEARVNHVKAEIKHYKQKLEVAFHTFEQIKSGHSYQSVTKTVPSAAERLMPGLEDLKRARSTIDLQRTHYDLYDTVSNATDYTSA